MKPLVKFTIRKLFQTNVIFSDLNYSVKLTSMTVKDAEKRAPIVKISMGNV